MVDICFKNVHSIKVKLWSLGLGAGTRWQLGVYFWNWRLKLKTRYYHFGHVKLIFYNFRPKTTVTNANFTMFESKSTEGIDYGYAHVLGPFILLLSCQILCPETDSSVHTPLRCVTIQPISNANHVHNGFYVILCGQHMYSFKINTLKLTQLFDAKYTRHTYHSHTSGTKVVLKRTRLLGSGKNKHRTL